MPKASYTFFPSRAFRAVTLPLLLAGVLIAIYPGQYLYAANERIAMQLEQVDIKDFVRWYAQVTHKTIIIHPQVSGTVTVISGKEISKNEAYEVFLATLQVHGYTVVTSEGALKVIPSNQATENEIPILSDEAQASAESIVVKILTVKNVAAQEVVSLLKPIASKYAYLTSYAPTNALIIADRASKVAQLERIISKIDLVGEVEVEMVTLTYANAQEVAQTINQLFNNRKQSSASGAKFNLTVDNRTNSILVTGDAISKSQIRELISNLDKPVMGSGNTSVIRLQYADASKIVPILNTVSGSIQRDQKDQRITNVDVQITADTSLNSLVITAPPSVMETMRAVIAELDARRAQVLVEAIIVEVSEDISRDLGIQWQSNLETGSEGVYGAATLFPSIISDGIEISEGVASVGSGLTLGYFRNGGLRGLIRALEGDSQANILSTPSIVALDNEEASILVGSNVPFVTGSIQRAGDANPFQTIQRQDIGVTLNIKPRVNNNNSLTLDIEQKVESIGQTDARTADIITNKRELSTRVLIENNDVLVLGGLVRDEVTETQSKVPFFGDIPLIGRLFRSNSNAVVKRNLMVFIHPVILPDRHTGVSETRSRYEAIRQQQLRFREKVDRLVLPSELPLLPEWQAETAGSQPQAVNTLP